MSIIINNIIYYIRNDIFEYFKFALKHKYIYNITQ